MTAQLEKKKSSRWSVFKKRRKKKQEQQNDAGNEKQCVTPPRSDATTAVSEDNSLLGKIVTKKRSKRNSNVEEAPTYYEDSVYAPPVIDFKPFAMNDPPPTAEAPKTVLAPVDTTPKQQPVGAKTVTGPVRVTRTPSPCQTKFRSSESDAEISTLVVDTEKPSEQTKNSPSSVMHLREASASPTAFFTRPRESTVSPTDYMSEFDPFGFPSTSLDEITPNQDESWNSFAHPFPNVNEPRKAAKPTPTPIKLSGTSARQAHPKKDEAVLAITKASTTKRLTTKEDMSVATKPSNDKDITHTCSPKVIDVKNIAASPAIKDIKASTAAPAIKEVKASTNVTYDDQSKAMAFDKAAEDEDDPSFSHLNESTLTESSMDISHNSDDSNLSQRTLFLRRRARERLIEEAKLKNAKESTKDKKAASPKALPGTSRRRKLQKFLELRDSHQKFLKSVENDATENKAESVHLRNCEAESVNKGLEPRASSTNNIQRKMQQLKEKRVSQKSLESRSSKPKNQTENSESKATATTTAFLEDPTMVPTTRPKPNDQTETAESKATATTTAFAEDPTIAPTTRPKPKDQTETAGSKATAATTAFVEDPTMPPTTRPTPKDQTETAESKTTATTTAFLEDPTMAPTTRPKQVSSINLKKKTYSTAVAHKSINRSREEIIEQQSDHPQKWSAGEELGSEAVAMQRILPKDLDTIEEIPQPSDLIRKSSSFVIERCATSEGRRRSNSFDHTVSQTLHSKVQDLPASSTGTDLYMKRHRPQLVDRYDSIEDDERSRFSSISFLSGAKRESATYHQAQDTALPSETESLPQELTQVVTVDDQDGEIEMMLPGGPKDALCKFEAYYSDGSDVNETTASCTVTSDDLHGEDDLHGDESWADTCSQADTNTLDSDDGSRSDCDESRSLVTTESRSFISETYTVEDSKITVTTDGDSYMSRSRGPTSNISDEYTLDDSKMTFRTDDSRSYESRSLLNESYLSRESETYISDDDSFDSDEGEPVDNYLWEDITAKIFMVKPWHGETELDD
jgi:hypothetical protein